MHTIDMVKGMYRIFKTIIRGSGKKKQLSLNKFIWAVRYSYKKNAAKWTHHAPGRRPLEGTSLVLIITFGFPVRQV
jgi:hypothetical protein